MNFKVDPEIFELSDKKIPRGKSCFLEISVARLYDFTELSIPVYVTRGKEPGPVFFISGAIHGDETIGPEIIKRLLGKKSFKVSRGTLICIPIVNVFGFNIKSRYLPDRKDLNRCFPGSEKGSLGARLAHIFLEEIVSVSDYGIDLHSGAIHRENFPQIRACLDNEKTKELAQVFGAPVILDSKIRDGSLRGASEEMGLPILLFEGGEALRSSENAIKLAVKGILNCLEHVKMVKPRKKPSSKREAFIAKSSYWVRASQSGIIRNHKKLGAKVVEGELLATISDVFGKNIRKLRAQTKGIVIGSNHLPLVNQGDALFHIATFSQPDLTKLSEDILLGEEAFLS